MPIPIRPAFSSLAVAAALLVVPVAAHADGWYAGETFATGATAQGADLALRADGNAAGAWLDAGSAQEVRPPADLYAQSLVGGRLAGPPVKLDRIVNPPGDFFEPAADTPVAVAAGPGGTAVVGWVVPVPNDVNQMKFARLRADGSATAPTPVSIDSFGPDPVMSAAMDERGVAILAVTDGRTVRALRITPDDQVSRITLGDADSDSVPSVVVSPAGTAWVAWTDGLNVRVARIDPAGVAAAPASYTATDSDGATLTVAPGGAAAAVAVVDDPGGANQVLGARLPATGPVLGASFRGQSLTAAQNNEDPFLPSLALAQDGTLTVARTGPVQAGPGATPESLSTVERFKPGSTARLAGVFSEAGGQLPLLPAVTAAPDGRALLAWTSTGGSAGSSSVKARTIAADDTLGPVSDVGPGGFPPELLGSSDPRGSGLLPTFTDAGAVLGLREVDSTTGAAALRTRVLDAAGPQVEVDVPAQAEAGTPVRFSQTATDARGIGAQSWDFGDGSTAIGATVTHTYAPGTYTVKAIATDGVGNVTEVARQITITAVPVAGPPPPGVVVPPPVVVVPPPPAVVPPKPPAAANLKVSKAIRTKRRLAVSGTIARSAGGRVTITYSVRIGSALTTVRKTATIKAGRWSGTLTLPSAVLKARRPATVSIAYAGDADTRKGTARSTVVTAKVKKSRARRP